MAFSYEGFWRSWPGDKNPPTAIAGSTGPPYGARHSGLYAFLRIKYNKKLLAKRYIS